MSQFIGWYTLRTIGTSEDKFLVSFRDNVALYKLGNRILDAQILKEFKIEESEEYSPQSDFLPKRGFKSGKSSVWVKLSNGNYKKIKLVEKRPLKGLIFIKMEYDLALFRQIKSWDMGVTFLGDPSPSAISEEKFQNMKNSLDSTIPSIHEYIAKKNYALVEGSIEKADNLVVQKSEISTNEDALPEETITISENIPDDLATLQMNKLKKEELYSDLNIGNKMDFLSDLNLANVNVSRKSGEKFKVNDFIFLKHLGFKGVIQAIDYEKDSAVVSIQMFGRRQPITCKIAELGEI